MCAVSRAVCIRQRPSSSAARQAFAFPPGPPSRRGRSEGGQVVVLPRRGCMHAPHPVLHVSAPVRRGAVADTRPGLA